MKVVDLAALMGMKAEEVKEMLKSRDMIELNLTEKVSRRVTEPDDMKILSMR